MKYLQLISNIKTIFVKNGESISIENLNTDTIKSKFLESIDKVKTMQDEKWSEKKISQSRVRKLKEHDFDEFIDALNSELEMLTNNIYCLFAFRLEIRELTFLVKINDEQNEIMYINEIKEKVSNIIKTNIDSILIKNDKEKELYVDTVYSVEDANIKDFFFKGLMHPDYYGLNVNSFIKNLNSKINIGDHYYSDEKLNNYLYEYNIPQKLTKDEFYDKYSVQILNKSFKAEIDRIYNSSNNYDVKLIPVHYEFTEYDEFIRNDYAIALATALYSMGRIKSNKMVKFSIDIHRSYFQNDDIYMLIKNLKGSFVFFEFFTDRNLLGWDRDDYYGRTSIRTKELTDNIINLKDEVQFAFYVDKYQDKVRTGIVDELNSLNLVTFSDKLNSDNVLEYVKKLAKNANISIDQKLINMVEMNKYDITVQDAKNIFDNYKNEKVKSTYFPEYKDYYEGRGNIDNYEDPYLQLMNMPGLHNVKKVVNEILNYHKLDEYKKEHFMEYKDLSNIKNAKYNGNSVCNHMIFMGNPGTCKTTVAKMIAKILKSRGIIKNDRTEIYGVDGRCIHLENAFKYAYGGVLFIDEAYSLGSTTDLVALMENHRNDVMVILAGYTNAMKQFLHRNEGLTSRFNYIVEFEDYTEDELWEILKYQVDRENLILDKGVKEKVMPIFSSSQVNNEMGNGRLVRKMLQMAMSNQAKRLSSIDFNKDVLNLSDINRLNCDDFDIDYKKLTGINSPKIIGNVDPEKELDNMIGLKNIKSMIKKCIASSYMNQIRKNTFEGNNSNSVISNPMHLAFLGNPGTAKTTVARLVARILKKKGVIKKENILEVGRKDLVAQYVGHTAPLVKSVFERAKGGVLFIDEAYSLVEDRSGSFGDEAINTIIAEMENHRDDVIVIFAGYTDRMREFIARNDGLRSRLSYVLEFEDYTNEELYKIFEKIISDYELIATSEAKKFVKTIFDDAPTNNDYGNGRFVRKLIENAKLNMDYRLAKLNKEKYTFEELKTLTMEDFKDIENDKILDMKKIHIGFAV